MRDALSSERSMFKLLAAAALVPLAISLEAGQAAKPISIEGATGLEFVQVVPQTATYKEHKALRLVQTPNATIEGVALVNGVEFKNGTLDVDLAALRRKAQRIRPRRGRDCTTNGSHCGGSRLNPVRAGCCTRKHAVA